MTDDERVEALEAKCALLGASLTRADALVESSYIAGAKAGYNLGLHEDPEGLARLIAAHSGCLGAALATKREG